MANSENRLDIGRVMNNTFGVIGRHPAIFLGLSFLIVGIPNGLVEIVQGQPEALATAFLSPTAVLGSVIGFFVMTFFSVVLQATLIVATINDLGNKPINLGDCVARAVRKFLPLIGLGILMSLGIGFGLLLLVVPGVILTLMWIIATPVMMAEDKGVIDSLKRSAELTSGSKGLIFLLLIIFIILASVIGFIGGMMSFWSTTAVVLVSTLVNTLTGAIQGAGVASVYVDLRTAKEGTDNTSLADIFA
ncbi:hypothetical protein [Parasphingorhabdus sp.]|uniref:hypothetical protein n=1 Tax=Parasphingorhabdus sp. TaxID=2709688 RepID=UPI003A94C9C9